ncbi:MAG TPA: hypothetical protein VF523_08955, partial [Burkholderiales bacterium]
MGGQLMVSADQGRSWKRREAGLPAAGVQALTVDPFAAQRLWAAGADRVYRSDDRGETWRNSGSALPELGTSVHGIAASADGGTLLLATQRGVYRSQNAGQTWALTEANLPVHLEAGVLVRDPSDPNTVYVGFALMPYAQIWRVAVEGGSLLGQLDAVSLAGGAAFLLLLGVIGSLLVVWLARRRALAYDPGRRSTK